MQEWKEQIPQNATFLYELLKKSGYDSYFVGGCVRDMLQGRQPKDWDMCSTAPADKLVEIYRENGITLDPTGLEYGTVVADFGGEKYEVATFKTTEDDSEQRLYANLSRRDFTINAMAYDLQDDRLYDFFGGQEDLKNKIIRMVGDPKVAVSRSPISIVRAIRQSIEFGFRIEKQSYQAMKEQVDLLEREREQRIIREIKKSLIYGEDFFVGSRG